MVDVTVYYYSPAGYTTGYTVLHTQRLVQQISKNPPSLVQPINSDMHSTYCTCQVEITINYRTAIAAACYAMLPGFRHPEGVFTPA